MLEFDGVVRRQDELAGRIAIVPSEHCHGRIPAFDRCQDQAQEQNQGRPLSLIQGFSKTYTGFGRLAQRESTPFTRVGS
jgi:hypothetical protein